MTYHYLPTVEQWGLQEITCQGPSAGNPFMEQSISAAFSGPEGTVRTEGFYDGDGRYIVRFMPSMQGEYTFHVSASFDQSGFSGAFSVGAPGPNNHGPVRVDQTFHFAYADGTRYTPVGTTCYVWHLQTPDMFRRTLDTLAQGPFNKIRFCVFPKHYDYNFNEPFTYPYEGTPCDSSWLTKDNFMQASGHYEDNHWDFTRFNPAHFRHLEKAILSLQQLGIEADIIILHPYDRWGFSAMTKEEDQRYFRYLARRIAAMRNVWWSLANEYDLLPGKSIQDWEDMAQTLHQNDPYHRLTSIHNCFGFYDHTRPWITHCCLQRQDLYRTTEYVDAWRKQYQKPVIVDEMGYEGNIQHGWGNLSGEEITRRFWEASIRGGYGGHGETFLNDEGVLWWSHGDALHGQSPARLQFLRSFLEELPGPLQRAAGCWDDVEAILEGDDEACPQVLVCYYSFMQPSFRDFRMPAGVRYQVEVIDTWNMTRENLGLHEGAFTVALPARSYMAIYLKRV